MCLGGMLEGLEGEETVGEYRKRNNRAAISLERITIAGDHRPLVILGSVYSVALRSMSSR